MYTEYGIALRREVSVSGLSYGKVKRVKKRGDVWCVSMNIGVN